MLPGLARIVDSKFLDQVVIVVDHVASVRALVCIVSRHERVLEPRQQNLTQFVRSQSKGITSQSHLLHHVGVRDCAVVSAETCSKFARQHVPQRVVPGVTFHFWLRLQVTGQAHFEASA